MLKSVLQQTLAWIVGRRRGSTPEQMHMCLNMLGCTQGQSWMTLRCDCGHLDALGMTLVRCFFVSVKVVARASRSLHERHTAQKGYTFVLEEGRYFVQQSTGMKLRHEKAHATH